MSDAWDDYRRLLTEPGPFDTPDWSVIEISGEDWREWLQGQITGDVRHLTSEHPVGFCLTKPTGQILSFGELSEQGESGWLTVPTATVGAILERAHQMVIMEDCEVALLERPVGWDPTGLLPGVQGEPVSVEAWRLHRLERSEPNWAFDVREKTLPPELGEKFAAKYLNYNKGCYTGQEVLQRIHSRGHTNRTWVVEKSETDKIQRVGFEQTNQAMHPSGHWLIGGYQRQISAEFSAD